MRHQIFSNASHPVLKTLIKDPSRVQFGTIQQKQWDKYPTPQWHLDDQQSMDSEIITNMNQDMARHNVFNSHIHQSSQISSKPQIGLVSSKKLISNDNSQIQKQDDTVSNNVYQLKYTSISQQTGYYNKKQESNDTKIQPQVMNKNQNIDSQQIQRPKSYSSQSNNVQFKKIDQRIEPHQYVKQPAQVNQIDPYTKGYISQEQEQRIKIELDKLKLQDEKRRHLLTPSRNGTPQHTPERNIKKKQDKSFMSTKSRDEKSPNMRNMHSYYNSVIEWCEYLDSELKNQSKLNNCQFNYLKNKLRLLSKELRSTQEFMMDRI